MKYSTKFVKEQTYIYRIEEYFKKEIKINVVATKTLSEPEKQDKRKYYTNK